MKIWLDLDPDSPHFYLFARKPKPAWHPRKVNMSKELLARHAAAMKECHAVQVELDRLYDRAGVPTDGSKP